MTVTSTLKQVKFSLVPQAVSLIPFFTVKETLVFASKTKNPSLTTQEHQQKVNNLLASFSMLDKTESKVMNLSGGEQRRLSIMVEGNCSKGTVTMQLFPSFL